ncbi:hypothetical protein [Streptomyces radiopugnans]|uniref:hypothetical protein n=1 Tax=Streptomyces radiopugnans TaxID=403935 RepID=UPI003F1C1564
MTAVPPPRQPLHPFLSAGHDHYRAARKLADGGALTGPADHLAGIAAECVIKAMLIDFFGSKQDKPDSIPYSPALRQAPGLSNKAARKLSEHGHLPEVWSQLHMLANGRRGAVLAQHIPPKNPFEEPRDEWNVAHRYRDGREISRRRVFRHLDAALRLITAYDRMK